MLPGFPLMDLQGHELIRSLDCRLFSPMSTHTTTRTHTYMYIPTTSNTIATIHLPKNHLLHHTSMLDMNEPRYHHRHIHRHLHSSHPLIVPGAGCTIASIMNISVSFQICLHRPNTIDI